MNEQKHNGFSNPNVEDGELTRPGDRNLPRILDPIVTMGVVQKYIETERKRSRRVLFWMSAVFMLAVLFILMIFISVGTFLYQNSRKAVGIADSISAQVAYYGVEVVGISNKINALEEKDDQIKDLVRNVENARGEDGRLLKTDLQRFSRWVESLNARDAKVLSELEARIREMQKTLDSKDKELEDLKKQYASVSGPGGLMARSLSGELPLVSAGTSTVPDKVDTMDIDVASISTTGLFDAVLDIRETNAMERIESKGEMSVVTFPGGDRYEGEFKGGLLCGRGIYYYRNGDRYEGEFRNDMKQGFGAYYYSNGDRYTGEFKSDMKEGKGSFVLHNGEKYVGDVRNDAMTGKGTMIYVNGNKYAGDFKNGLKNGNGVLCFYNGDIYKGEFRNDLRNGKGVYFFSDGAKYIGDFKNDKREGSGRYIYPGGEEYVGGFKDGRKAGEGVCIYPNGKQLKGLWKDDKLVEEMREQ